MYNIYIYIYIDASPSMIDILLKLGTLSHVLTKKEHGFCVGVLSRSLLANRCFLILDALGVDFELAIEPPSPPKTVILQQSNVHF